MTIAKVSPTPQAISQLVRPAKDTMILPLELESNEPELESDWHILLERGTLLSSLANPQTQSHERHASRQIAQPFSRDAAP